MNAPPERPIDARSDLGEQLVQDLYADWEKHGIDAIIRVRKERPVDYLKIIVTLIELEDTPTSFFGGECQ
jgi:hypothetical protein